MRNGAPASELDWTDSRSHEARLKSRRLPWLFVAASLLFALALAGCGGTTKQSCKLTGFVPAPGSPLVVGNTGESAFSSGPAVDTADFNGDGYSDLVVPVEVSEQLDADQGYALETRNGLEILLGSAGGAFREAPGSPVVFPVKANSGGTGDLAAIDLVIGDWNGDGRPDLADVGGWPDQPVSVLLGDGKGGFGNSKPAQRELLGGDKAFVVPASLAPVSADLNGDGRTDIASAVVNLGLSVGAGGWHASSDSAKGYVLLGDGTGGFRRATDSPVHVGSSPVAIASADFNGNDRPDLAIAGAENRVRVPVDHDRRLQSRRTSGHRGLELRLEQRDGSARQR